MTMLRGVCSAKDAVDCFRVQSFAERFADVVKRLPSSQRKKSLSEWNAFDFSRILKAAAESDAFIASRPNDASNIKKAATLSPKELFDRVMKRKEQIGFAVFDKKGKVTPEAVEKILGANSSDANKSLNELLAPMDKFREAMEAVRKPIVILPIKTEGLTEINYI